MTEQEPNPTTERVDLRGEWYRDFDPWAASRPRIPVLYWIGMLASAVWLVVYLLIYPSIPLPGGHWHGLGVPGGCQPWTAICEQERKQARLDEVRGKFLRKIATQPVTAIAEDIELREFIARAARVTYGDQCAGCHGPVEQLRRASAKVNIAALLNPAHHPFGLLSRVDEIHAKLMAVYLAP